MSTSTHMYVYLPQRRRTHWSPLEVWRCQTVGHWDPRGLSLCCFCVRFRSLKACELVYIKALTIHMHTYILLLCMYVCHLHVLKLVASEGSVQLAIYWDTRLQLSWENSRPYHCSVAYKHHRNLQIDKKSQNWNNNNYNRFIYVGDNNEFYTIAQWSCNKLVSLSKWYVSLTIRLSSTQSSQ